MGIIEKQATRSAIYSYLGAGLGFLTVIWLSHVLSPSENGALRVLLSYSILFSQFANLGFTAVTNRFFPYFRDKTNGHNGFLYYAIWATSIGFFISFIVYLALKDTIISNNTVKSPIFIDYLFYLMPLSFFTVFFNIFDSYLKSNFNSVIGPFAKDFLQRVLILIVILLYFLNIINFSTFFLLYVVATSTPTLILLFYIIANDEWHIKPSKGFISRDLRREMIKLSIYSILASGAVAITSQIDSIMINKMLGEEKTGVYGIAFYFGTIILIPARSIYRASSSIVAELFKENEIDKINNIYKQSCNTQYTIGLLLFIGIWINIDSIMQLLPPEYASGKSVILILTLGNLVEMATGINQVIILNSKYYKFDAYLIAFTVIIIVLANLIFIPIYGITGSALATTITVSFSNIVRLAFLKIKFNMQPYDTSFLKLSFIAIISSIIGYMLPEHTNPFIEIFYKSISITTAFIVLIIKLKAAPEINLKIKKNLKRVKIDI